MKDIFSTITNISYIIVGVMVLVDVNYARFFSDLGLFLTGAAFVSLGIASTGFHWTRNDTWHKFDMIAIVYAFGAIAGYLWAGAIGTVVGVLAAVITHYYYEDMNGSPNIKYFIVGFGLAALARYVIIHPPLQVLDILIIFAMAFMCGQFAEKYLNRSQMNYDFLHGIWHILTAYGMYLLLV